MRRFALLLRNELSLFRTALPIHLVALFQPTVLYLLMSVILVHPTFEMHVLRPTSGKGRALLAAMEQVGSPIGVPYIRPIVVDRASEPLAQIVTVEQRGDQPVAVQRYGLIDSNQVKNYRNRLTAAGMRLWNDALGDRAVRVEEHPWLPSDVSYLVYFGVALLPLTAFLSGSLIGGFLTAQDFEARTIDEYRLAPLPMSLLLAARMVRLVLLALLSAGLLVAAVGLLTGGCPDSIWRVGAILLPVAVIGGGLGMVTGLLVRRVLPTFVVCLVASLAGWLLGGAFGLPGGFGGVYEQVSRWTPNTYTVDLLFLRYYGTHSGVPIRSALVLLAWSVAMVVLTAMVYRRRVLGQG